MWKTYWYSKNEGGHVAKGVSGFVPSTLRSNPSLSLRTSDTRWNVIGEALQGEGGRGKGEAL